MNEATKIVEPRVVDRVEAVDAFDMIDLGDASAETKHANIMPIVVDTSYQLGYA